MSKDKLHQLDFHVTVWCGNDEALLRLERLLKLKGLVSLNLGHPLFNMVGHDLVSQGLGGFEVEVDSLDINWANVDDYAGAGEAATCPERDECGRADEIDVCPDCGKWHCECECWDVDSFTDGEERFYDSLRREEKERARQLAELKLRNDYGIFPGAVVECRTTPLRRYVVKEVHATSLRNIAETPIVVETEHCGDIAFRVDEVRAIQVLGLVNNNPYEGIGEDVPEDFKAAVEKFDLIPCVVCGSYHSKYHICYECGFDASARNDPDVPF